LSKNPRRTDFFTELLLIHRRDCSLPFFHFSAASEK